MKKQTIILFAAAITFCCSCNSSEQNNTAAADTAFEPPKIVPATADNSRTSVDWPGTYKGTLPCADCQGIETTLTIDTALNYTLTQLYLGKSTKPFEQKGSFSWNGAGGIITLSGISNAPSQYLVGENVLVQLDLEGNRISGELADKYRLQKLNP
ncbi:MAG TPA: copper resistance protein NlpE [Ferruginibacter sp.]|nr:copper resistance protein NlpE [Ferruginibacter sp.]HMP19936.1 copper resistance protein NlpE [Ferruginibacter sp.]